jgi:hypothetical protein
MSTEGMPAAAGVTVVAPVAARRRAPLWLDPEEADAFLAVLMTAPPTPNACPTVADRLMCRVATVRRALLRPAPAAHRRKRRRVK